MTAKSKPAAPSSAVAASAAPLPSALPTKLGELAIEPVSLGHFILLEKIDSPLLFGKETPIGMKDLAAAAAILTDGKGAQEALAQDRATFDALAFNVALQIPLSDLKAIASLLVPPPPKA